MSDPLPNLDPNRTPGVRHETTDVSLKGLLLFVAAMALVAVLIHLAVGVVFRAFTGADLANRKARALSSAVPGPLPAPPVLEGLAPGPGIETPTPPATWGWVDRGRGIARIPVEEAKAILAGTLPSRDQVPEVPLPTDANGGQPRKGSP